MPPQSVPYPAGNSPAEIARIVVVDDDSRVVAAIGETVNLEPDLLMVGEASDAVSALVVVMSTDPDVVLVDVLLPDDDIGLALVRTLSRRSKCAVIAMSVRSNQRSAALAAGAVAFVEKGDDIDALLNEIRTAARNAI